MIAIMALTTAAPPTYDDVEVVVPAPGPGAGNWAGAASAVLVDGVFWLTWRVRRPLTDGRGVSVVVARSSDGVTFEPVTEVSREAFGAESFERPVLVPLREGGWRLYLSCATPGSKHWWVDSLTADTVEGLPDGVRRRVHEGDRHTGVKDPVITVGRRRLRDVAVLPPARRARPRGPDDHAPAHQRRRARLGGPRRGARRTPRRSGTPAAPGSAPCCPTAWSCTTAARTRSPTGSRPPAWRCGTASALTRTAQPPISSPHADGAFRYATAVPLPDGRVRYYVEAARSDGAHDLVTCVR